MGLNGLRGIRVVTVMSSTFPADAGGGTGVTADSVFGVRRIVGDEAVTASADGAADGRSLTAGLAPCSPDCIFAWAIASDCFRMPCVLVLNSLPFKGAPASGFGMEGT